jgi:hypothetical protein
VTESERALIFLLKTINSTFEFLFADSVELGDSEVENAVSLLQPLYPLPHAEDYTAAKNIMSSYACMLKNSLRTMKSANLVIL